MVIKSTFDAKPILEFSHVFEASMAELDEEDTVLPWFMNATKNSSALIREHLFHVINDDSTTVESEGNVMAKIAFWISIAVAGLSLLLLVLVVKFNLLEGNRINGIIWRTGRNACRGCFALCWGPPANQVLDKT